MRRGRKEILAFF